MRHIFAPYGVTPSRAILAAAMLSLVLKALLAFHTLGTNDVLTWEGATRVLMTDGPRLLYLKGAPTEKPGELRQTQIFNHPPPVLHLLNVWDALARVTGLPAGVILRLTSSVADAVTLWIVYLTVRRSSLVVPTGIWVLLALHPVAIMVAGFHGNTDPIMICFLIACVYCATAGRIVPAGLAFGLAMSIKIVPVMVAPVLLLWIRAMPQRLMFMTTAGATFLAAGLPYSIEYPRWAYHVFGYGGSPSPWGFGMAAYLWYEPPLGYLLYMSVAKYVILGVISFVAWNVNRWDERPLLLTQVGFSLAVLLFLTSGFGVQYLYWLVPFSVVLGRYAVSAYALCAGVFAFHLYTLWSGGLPWNFANAYRYSGPMGWTPSARVSSFVAWVCVSALLASFARRMLAGRSPGGAVEAPCRSDVKRPRTIWP